ncbi:hypothetical protein BO94DRAFT_328502 [Aspergillus sclerotioniger CBS 115572]|uniref:Uncharacterized protein n=1 Tax=Aspergillus sclerotioniger CBS 115572 TaxID=1450535 RepID=A0A317X6R3_9EURO|nr:hypothetical protein BO94DRAFT_328502 [Aspergillus sclerotioniger CBS 115572]PWY94316.1 hypothetical protein BO94DRAFT_328502 [Aspergillus sclerotioniger CBS 115572]
MQGDRASLVFAFFCFLSADDDGSCDGIIFRPNPAVGLSLGWMGCDLVINLPILTFFSDFFILFIYFIYLFVELVYMTSFSYSGPQTPESDGIGIGDSKFMTAWFVLGSRRFLPFHLSSNLPSLDTYGVGPQSLLIYLRTRVRKDYLSIYLDSISAENVTKYPLIASNCYFYPKEKEINMVGRNRG